MAAASYTHLHVHSHYSLLGATPGVSDLAARAAADGLTHLALTDTDALYGAVAFARACSQAGVQPILGMAVHVAPLPGMPTLPAALPGLLILLAAGPAGYRSLCRLSSLIQGRSDRQAAAARGLELSALHSHREGLICLSGGRRGWIERSVRAGDTASALRFTRQLAALYGERAYVALELHRPPEQAVVDQLAELARRAGIGTVAAQPIYCLAPAERARLRLLAAMERNCRLDAVPPAALPDGGDTHVDLHWLAPAEMRARFAHLPAALAASGDIARQCAPALPDGRPIWPGLALPPGETPAGALTQAAGDGLARLYGPHPDQAVAARLQTELSAIIQHGFDPLFLLVADIVRFARSREIPVSTRGSVANSLVAYCVGISNVDPIQHQLLFERFLNPARAQPPDIDLDFCSRRRNEVLAYVRRTYGANRVAMVATVSTLRARSAVRETAKAYGLSDQVLVQLLKLLPSGWHPDPRRRDRRGVEDLLAQIDDPRLRRVVQDAYGLVGQPHHLSVHPGGVVVTPGPLTDVVPVQWAPRGFTITQYDHSDVEALGLPKIDLLGIRALTVLADAAELVRRHHDPSFRLTEIPAEDRATAQLLAMGDTVGVFQCESSGARRTLRQLRAQSVRDLAVANAFFKPGPATGGMARTFIRRYRGEAPTQFLHPTLAPILAATHGVLLFQEQILRVAREIAGLSWAEADHLRRGMSKFVPDEMAAIRDRFVQGCCRPAPNGPALTPRQAETLWEQVQAFAGYGFNQGHATAYADVSYRSAYVKCHWPAAFLAARLAVQGGFHHPAVYIAEAIRLGIRVRPPHVNQSDPRFTLQWTEEAGRPEPLLWMGLGQVRDLRRTAMHSLIQERAQRPFTDLRDLLRRTSLQPKEITHLIQCGACDGLGENRAGLLQEWQEIGRAGSAQQLGFAFAQPAVPAETLAQRLGWERRLLGQPVSEHPLALVQPLPADLVPLAQLAGAGGGPLRVAGVRLPGWTGGKGFFLSDGQSYVTAIGVEAMPPRSWRPLIAYGQWRVDLWGGGWLQLTSWSPLADGWETTAGEG